MEPVFSFYTPADFGRVYQFLRDVGSREVLAYDAVRFQFSFLHVDFVGNGLQAGHERTCGIWADERGVASLVLTEGGTQWGESFFVFRDATAKTKRLMGRMCDFAERFTSRVAEDGKSNRYSLSVPDDDEALIGFLAARGYTKTGHRERVMAKPYPEQPEAVILPHGFTIRDARTVSPFYTALAHNHSFRYNQHNDGGQKGFERVRTMPDYRPELDLVLFDAEGQPAGLANFWVHEKSSIAVMEPLGVVWWYRRLGLGEALVTEGINRTRAHGCNRLVGGDMPFYWELGFVPLREHHYWAWQSA